MKLKIQTLLNQLNNGLVEREGILKITLLTVLAGENLVLIGPPGTGKSLIARRVANSLEHDSDDNSGYFEYLLTKFSTPEEIFEPLSITELKADRFKRNTVGYLPTVKVAFLDEIFKASSSILNALLTILNERIYHNGAVPQSVPMQALIAASNELPADQEELCALYDRFLVRSFVDYVSQDNLVSLFEKTETKLEVDKLTAGDLDNIQCSAEFVTIPKEVVDAILCIWMQHKETFKEDRRESLSDRRLKKVIKLLKVSAATNGRKEVDLSDVFLLKNCLWNHQENAVIVRDLILNILQAFSRSMPQSEIATLSGIDDEQLTNKLEGEKTLDLIQPRSVQCNNMQTVVVKGFKGNGTAHDPLLVETFDELMSLVHPVVGLQGYFFRQTADIDCTALSTWMNIPSFKGHYDGGGHIIKYKKIGDDWGALFSHIQEQSSIANLRLEGVRLATKVESSRITHCLSTIDLIKGEASNCTITACESNAFLIWGTAINCIIADCLAVIDLDWKTTKQEIVGGIVSIITKGSTVERCFVTGALRCSGDEYFYFSGIVYSCDDSIIRQCALGRFKLSGAHTSQSGRIINRCANKCIINNNASIGTNEGQDDINGVGGKTVPSELFKQRYFNCTLDWDFETVWQWDDVNDRPALRSVGLGTTQRKANTTDLLTQQMRANIWL